LDESQIQSMTEALRDGRTYTRVEPNSRAVVYYGVHRMRGGFYAWWEVDVRVAEDQRLELACWKNFEQREQAVDYLVAHRKEPAEYAEVLRSEHLMLLRSRPPARN
jgi:hypothetical protein